MIINKTCRKAGHRWGVPMRSEIRDGSWVIIERCQRRACDRMRTEWSNGVAFTYRQDPYGRVLDRHEVAPRRSN
jgi:hypothetical protein